MSGWSRRDMILAGSLAVNLLLAGFVLGAGARALGGGGFHGGPSQMGPGAELMHPRAVIAGLPADERRAALREFRREGARARPMLREARAARDELAEALAREPFDADNVRAAFELVREAEAKLHERGQDLMIALLARMSPEERAEFVRAMHDRHRGHGRRSRRRHGGGAPGGGAWDGPRDGSMDGPVDDEPDDAEPDPAAPEERRR